MDVERWQRLSPLLDALLDLDEAERAQRLHTLRAEDPALAAELEALIALEDGQEDFLDQPLVPPVSGLRAGSVIGPYKLERMLGEGGMGQVWLAGRADGLYQRRVALKLLRPGLADPNLRLRFTRERQILARLAHPHIARLLDAGVADNVPYLALEYVEGEPITDYCKRHGTPVETRLRMFQQICDAVSHAHANLIVHRDLKPSNILVTPAGDVRLLDFGIAKLLDSEAPVVEQTRTGVRAFTLHYAAPEQIRGEPVTTMTDVYSLGVVLYELLTDAKPYRLKRNTDAEWEEAILAVDPLRPSQTVLKRTEQDTRDRQALRRLSRYLAGDLDNIVLKALCKRPEQRYPSVEAVAQDLQRFESGRPVLARPQSLGYRVQKYLVRHRWALAAGALTTVVISLALGIVAWQAREAVNEASRAQAMQDFMAGLFEHASGMPEGSTLDLRALLDAAVERGDRELARQPRARAELL
ncbi:MAG TPA: serine/threonine-protein kinase, partial [Lysobacter sp.]